MHPLIDGILQRRFEVGNVSKQIHDDQYQVITELLQNSICPNMQTVEIGSWTGLSAVLIGQIVQRMSGTHHCVDWFRGTEDNDGYLKETSQKYNIKEVFLENVSYFEIENTIKLLEMKSEEAVKYFENESLSFIFIDGDHKHEAVLQDIEMWFPKLKLGGGISGHDYLASKQPVDYCFQNRTVTEDIWYIKKETHELHDNGSN